MELERARSLIDFLPDGFRKYIEGALPYMDLAPNDLEELATPNYTDYRLKRTIWALVDNSKKSGRKVTMVDVYKNVCSRMYMYTCISNPKKLAWYLSPLENYDTFVKSILDMAMNRYHDLITMKITVPRRVKNSEGVIETVEVTDPKAALVLLSTIKQIEDRTMGKSIDRQIQVKETLQQGDRVESFDMGLIDKRLKELQQKLGESHGLLGESDLHAQIEGNNGEEDEDSDSGDEGAWDRHDDKPDIVIEKA